MIIKKLILENIKSYVYEEIDFTQGINFILGTNGSGKTTIIESIGSALFNFSKGAKTDLLRYNKTKGSIELQFIANDDREYKIVKNFRPKSSTVKIIDIDNNVELFSGVSEVYSFIKSILKTKKSKDLTKMFEEIIAVPQGQYVSAFLDKPASRKENFDRLFDLHIYKNLSSKLTSISSNIKENNITVLKESVDLITGQTEKHEDKKKELADVITQIKNLSSEEDKINKEILKLQADKNKLEKKKTDLEQLKVDIRLMEEKIKNINQLINNNNIELKIAQEALKVVEENKNGYIQYQENINQISILENKYENFLVVEKKLKDKESNYNIIESNIKNLEENKLEKRNTYNTRHQEIIELNKESIFMKDSFEKKKKDFDIKANINRKGIESINNEKNQLISKQTTLQNYQILYGERVIKDWTPYENLDNKVSESKKKLEHITKIKEEFEKVSKAKTALSIELGTAITNSQVSRDGSCPFLKEKCKNIDGESLTDYFKKIIDEKNQEIEKIDIIYYRYENEISEERKYISELQTQENNLKFLNEYEERMNKLKNQLFEEYQEMISINESKTLPDYIKEIKDEINYKLSILIKNEEDLNIIKNSLTIEDTSNNNLQFKIEQNKIKINELEKQNKTLNDEIEGISRRISLAVKELNTIKNDMINLKDELTEVSDSKGKLNKLKLDNINLEVQKNAYLSNITKSKEVEKILKVIETDRKLVSDLNIKLIQINNDIDSLEGEYSEDSYRTLSNNFTKAIESRSSIITSITEKGDQRNKLQNEVIEMDRLLVIKEEKEIQLQRYYEINEFITKSKKIFADLPRELSIKYREHISNSATRIYRQISKEKVQLELTEDYGVIITEDENPKNQKSIDVLSGGEQMSVAIAIRLSMLKGLTGLDIYFLDEPTVNLDQERRARVADVVEEIADDLTQLFVISHDDTFDQITDSVIKISKIDNESKRG